MKYEFIETKIFSNQLIERSKKFSKIIFDWDDFKENFELSFGIHLGEGIYKFRIKNSSIPTGKSGGFRVILKVYQNNVLPLIIYSKTEKSNVSKLEIKQTLKDVLEEL